MVFHREAGSFISSINILVTGALLDARDRLSTRPTQTLLDTHSPPWQPPQGLALLHGVGPLHSSLYLSTSQKHLSLWPSPKVTSIKNFQWLWRRQWHPTPVLLPGKSHGRRSLVGCSPWGHEESDTTEQLHFHFSLSCIGEGNGNPLQCSCLGNPRDGGACWAAVYGVAQSWTRLKRLSSMDTIGFTFGWALVAKLRATKAYIHPLLRMLEPKNKHKALPKD